LIRSILRKLNSQRNLTATEYGHLMEYGHDLRINSPPSYRLFYQRYGTLLQQDYQTYLPRFAFGTDDFFDYLSGQAEILRQLLAGPLPIGAFPGHLHEYLQDSFPDGMVDAVWLPALDLLAHQEDGLSLPAAREKEVVCKYESANAYKEIGLKSHFDRVGRYSFVSRLQSIRYLTGKKAGEDRLEMVSGDCLGGVFTNKEKSIYYYAFLTEDDPLKAQNACNFLNKALYGR
jgi:hypothetical protein